MRRPSSLLARRLLYASSARRRATAASSSSTLLSKSSSSSHLPSSDGGATCAARSVSIGIGGTSAVASPPPPSAHSNISTLRPPRGRRFRPPPAHQHHRHYYRPFFFDSTSSLDRHPPRDSSSIIRHHSTNSSSSSSATTNRASNEGRIEAGNDDSSIIIGKEDAGEECYARALEALRHASQAKKRHEEGLVREQFEAMAKQREKTMRRRQREEMQRGGKEVDPRLRRLNDAKSAEENEGGGSQVKDRAAGVAVVRTIVKQSRKDMAVRVERFAGGSGDAGGGRSGAGTGTTENADESSSSEVDDEDGDEEYWQRVARSRMEEAALRHGHPSALVRLGNEALERANDGDSSTAAQPLIDAERCREWMDESPLDLAAILDLVVGVNAEGIEESSPSATSSSPPAPLRLALRLYEEAGVRGSAEGWFNLGHVLWDGGGHSTADDAAVDGDRTMTKERAMAAFHEAMGLGDADAMYFVAAQYMAYEEEGGDGADGPLLSQTHDLHGPSFVTSLWSKAPISLEAVDAIEQRLPPLSSASSVSPGSALGQHGRELLRIAALAHGHGPALHHLALLHDEHDNAEEFARLLSRAVDVAGNPDSLFLRGHCRHFGADGHHRDTRGALKDFLAAAECGHADAMVSAGAMLHGGVVGDSGTVLVERDQRRAFELYQQAGELGSVEGWRNVVSCYATGQGVPRCLDTARHIATTMLKSDN